METETSWRCCFITLQAKTYILHRTIWSELNSFFSSLFVRSFIFFKKFPLLLLHLMCSWGFFCFRLVCLLLQLFSVNNIAFEEMKKKGRNDWLKGIDRHCIHCTLYSDCNNEQWQRRTNHFSTETNFLLPATRRLLYFSLPRALHFLYIFISRFIRFLQKCSQRSSTNICKQIAARNCICDQRSLLGHSYALGKNL